MRHLSIEFSEEEIEEAISFWQDNVDDPSGQLRIMRPSWVSKFAEAIKPPPEHTVSEGGHFLHRIPELKGKLG